MIPGTYFGLSCFPFWRWFNVTVLGLMFLGMIAFLTLPPAWFRNLPSSPKGARVSDLQPGSCSRPSNPCDDVAENRRTVACIRWHHDVRLGAGAAVDTVQGRLQRGDHVLLPAHVLGVHDVSHWSHCLLGASPRAMVSWLHDISVGTCYDRSITRASDRSITI